MGLAEMSRVWNMQIQGESGVTPIFQPSAYSLTGLTAMSRETPQNPNVRPRPSSALNPLRISHVVEQNSHPIRFARSSEPSLKADAAPACFR